MPQALANCEAVVGARATGTSDCESGRFRQRAKFLENANRTHRPNPVIIVYEYFRQYLDGIQRTPNGSQTWTDYCRGASPEAMCVIEIEQVAQDFDGLIPEAERAILDADLAEAKSCLYREDVDHLRRRYFIPVQHGGVMMFNRSYGYDTLPLRKGN